MKNIVLIMSLVAVFTIISTACNKGTAAVAPEGRDISFQYTAEELKEDFNQFRRIIERKTARFYTKPDELEKNLNEAEKSIDRPMTELEFYRLIAPIVADLRCGHSFLSVSAHFEKHLREEARFFSREGTDYRWKTFCNRRSPGNRIGTRDVNCTHQR